VKRLTIAATAALVLASTAGAADPITGKVRGVFNRAGIHGVMFGGENLRRYVKTPEAYVWCAWAGRQGAHPREDEEHLSRAPNRELVPALPDRAWRLARGRFLIDRVGRLRSGEVRNLTSKQDPKGVRDNSRIASCRPAFQMIKSG
jgi:hypothetical protein